MRASYRHMALTSSPYDVFHASDWNSVVAEPIGLSQFLRIALKKLYPQMRYNFLRSGTILKKTPLNTHVQLAFEWHVNILIVAAIGIAERFLLVISINVLYLMEII